MIGKRLIKIISKIEKILESGKSYTLPGVIYDDLMQFGKLPLFLFICSIVTSIMVITTVHYTRLLAFQREQIILARDALDIEWRNLILEKNVLSEYSRIERIATEKLHMRHVDPYQENIVIQNLNKCGV